MSAGLARWLLAGTGGLQLVMNLFTLFSLFGLAVLAALRFGRG